MEDGIAAANGGFGASEGLPGYADARLESSLVPLNAYRRDSSMALSPEESENVPLAGSKFAWRFAASVIGSDKAQARPRFSVKLLVTRQSSWTYGRKSFHRRPVVVTFEGLIVDGQAGQAHEEIGFGIAGPRHRSFPKSHPGSPRSLRSSAWRGLPPP